MTECSGVYRKGVPVFEAGCPYITINHCCLLYTSALAPLAGGAGAGVLTALGAAFETLCGLFQNLYDTVLELSLIHI